MYLTQVPDLCDISGFTYEWDFDQENYEEWLKENDYIHNEDTFMEYIIDNVMFTLFYSDHDTSHYMGQIDLDYDDIVGTYGENIAEEMIDVLGIQGKEEGEIEKCDLFNEEIDVNNPYELNKAAMTILPHGEYGKGNRGFILTNGVFVFTEGEHNECSQIPGIRGTFHFLELGNIRVLPESIDIPSEPTREQEQTLAEIIRCYENEYLYITLFDKRGEHDVRFTYPQYNRILNEIDRFFRDGIIPTGESFHESKRPRSIREILTEATDGHFSTQELMALPNFTQKMKYCQQHLGKYVGKGSSRIVYQIDDEKVLKLAWNEKGLWQNSEEASWFKKNYDIFPKIYEYDDNNYQWIICEYVLPANVKDFKYCLGLSWKDFRIFVTTASSQYGDPENKLISTQDFIDLCEEEPFLDELNRYMCDYCLNTFYDLCDLANWGLTQRNGNACLVLLDHGINDIIYNKFYS